MNGKKIISVLCSAIIAFSALLIPHLSSFDAKAITNTDVSESFDEKLYFNEYEYIVLDDSSIAVTGYTGSGDTVEIPAQIEGKPVEKIAAEAFIANTGIKNIVIPNGVLSIEDNAFSQCTSLLSVTIPQSITSISPLAFEGCDKLVIHGITGSYAENYAKDNNIKFVDDTVTVPQQVMLDKNDVILGLNETISLTATLLPENSQDNLTWSSDNKTVAIVDANGKITAKKCGSATVSVKTSNGKTASCKVTVKTAPSSVSLNKTSITLGVGEDYTLYELTNKGTYANEDNLKWSSSNSKVAVVEKMSKNKAKITAKGEGTATITVKTYNGKTASCKVTVKGAPSKVNLSKTSLKLGVGESLTIEEITNKGTYANADNLKWSSSDSNVVAVVKQSSNKAKLTAKGKGTAAVTLKLYNGTTANCTVTVMEEPSKVTLKNTDIVLGKGETYIISETTNNGSYANSDNLKWSSSNSKIVTVNKQSGNKAKITAKGSGTAKITVKLYNGKTASCKVTVKTAPSSVSLNKTSITLGVGEDYTLYELTNKGTYANEDNLKWSSSNSKVAVVEKMSKNKAKITAKGEGTATITVKTYNGKTASCKVTVKGAPSKVNLSKTSLKLGVGESLTIEEITNKGTYANADNLKWSSSDSNVVAVVKQSSNKAKLTAKGKGTAAVTLKLYNGTTANCTVTVMEEPSKVTLKNTDIVLGKGETYIISETTNNGSYANSDNLKWSSSNSKIVTVNKQSGNKAKITAKGSGTAKITVKLYNGKTASCKVTVKTAPSSVTLNESKITLGKGENFTIFEKTNTGTYANADNLKWSSSNSKVAVVEKMSKNKAKITAKGEGTATITVKTYNGKTASCKVTVKAAPKSVKLSTTYKKLNLDAVFVISETTDSGSYANRKNLKWSSSNNKVVEVKQISSNKAKLIAKGVGSATITLKLYNGLSASCKITVEKMKMPKSKVINAPFISQLEKYPTGCESVSTVMALKYAGINISVDKFIDSYLPTRSFPFDPDKAFGGNPRSTHGFGCYSPVIKSALDKLLKGEDYEAIRLSNVSLDNLCSKYICNDIPVIIWATMDMQKPYVLNTWVCDGKTINWIVPEHCLLLVGYDEKNYIFNDPLKKSAKTYYSKASVETAYKGMKSQAIVLI